jgi:hypothetical protein
MKKIIRHEIIEVVIPAKSSSTRFLLGDYPNLRNVHLWGIQAYTFQTNGKLGINTLLPIITYATLTTGYLTLVNYGGKEFSKDLPMLNYFTYQGATLGGEPFFYETDSKNYTGQKANYPKSYVNFSSAPASSDTDTVIMLSVYYSLPLAEEQLEQNLSFGNRK